MPRLIVWLSIVVAAVVLAILIFVLIERHTANAPSTVPSPTVVRKTPKPPEVAPPLWVELRAHH